MSDVKDPWPLRQRIALALAVGATLAGWACATLGHDAETRGLRSVFVILTVICAMTVFFSLVFDAHERSKPDAPRSGYSWQLLPGFLAITPMATIFFMGLTPLGVLVGIGLAILGPVPRLQDVVADGAQEEIERDKRFRYRPKVLDK